MADTVVDVVVGAFEGGLSIERHWIRNGPVQPGEGVAELFVGVVADCDDEVIVIEELVEVLGSVAFDAETVAVGKADSPRVNARAGMRAG